MPLANNDSSELTRVRRAMALASFQVANAAAVNAGRSVRREQTSFETLDVVTARRQGVCYCVTGGNPGGQSGCGCGGFK